MTEKPRIILGEDDFGDRETEPSGTAPPSGPQSEPSTGALPPVAPRQATQLVGGDPAKAGSSPGALNNPRIAPLIAAACGMALAWAVSEILGLADAEGAETKSALNQASALWTGVISVVFVGVVASFDRAVHGSWEAAGRRFLVAAIPAFILGYASGYAAQAIYTEMLESAVKSAQFVTGEEFKFYLARMVGWSIFGLGVGVALGVVERSGQRTINCAIGGALGGAAGGAIFHYSAFQMESPVFSRLMGLLAIGLLIALAMRLVETARREAWLSVVAGGMAGKEFIIYHPLTRIGSSPDCEVFLLKDPAVAKLHAQVEDRGTERGLTAAEGAATYVNETAVSTHTLRAGDQIRVGNTVIAYAERVAPAAATGPPARVG